MRVARHDITLAGKVLVALFVAGLAVNVIVDGAGDMGQRPKCESSDIRNGAARP